MWKDTLREMGNSVCWGTCKIHAAPGVQTDCRLTKRDEAGQVLSPLQLGLLQRPSCWAPPLQNRLPRTMSRQILNIPTDEDSVFDHSHKKNNVFLCSDGISSVLACAQWLLHCQQALRSNGWLPLPYCLPSFPAGICTHGNPAETLATLPPLIKDRATFFSTGRARVHEKVTEDFAVSDNVMNPLGCKPGEDLPSLSFWRRITWHSGAA